MFMPYGPHAYNPNNPTAEEYKRRLALEQSEGAGRKPLLNIIRNKTKLVAWIVSNCDSKSGRNSYANQLKKYINVDVYGACGSLKCSNCCKLFI